MVLEADDEVICRSEPFIIRIGRHALRQRGGRPDTETPCGRPTRIPTWCWMTWAANFGRVWRETAEADANHETLIRDLLDDQYSRPRRIVAFNTAEGWSRDVTLDVADEITATVCRVRRRTGFGGGATGDGKALKPGRDLRSINVELRTSPIIAARNE